MKPLSLRAKINAAILTTFAVVTFCSVLILYPFEVQRRQNRYAEIEVLLSAVFEQKREELANEIFAGQFEALKETLRQIQKVSGIERLVVYNADGERLFSTHPDAGERLSSEEMAEIDQTPRFARVRIDDGPFAVFSRVIQVIGERTGYIKIYFSLEKIENETRWVVLLLAALFLLTLMLMSGVLNMMLFRSVIRPVHALRNGIRRLQEGDFQTRVDLPYQDEIGEMGEAFNDMAKRLNQQRRDLARTMESRDHYFRMLEESNQALKELNANLEEMVESRTRELIQSNEKLQQEINERQRTDEEKRKLEQRLARSQKMEALGLLAGGVAHDLNNVLSGLVSYPDLILMDLAPDSPLRRPITTIRKSGQEAAAIVQDLLVLARRGVSQTHVLNLNTHVIFDYLNSPEFMELQSRHGGIRFETDLAPDLFNIRGSKVHLKKTLMNLVSNAAEAQPDGGSIRISTRNRYVDRPTGDFEKVAEGDYAVLTVADDGTGIDAKDLNRIFEPFYTKKVMGRTSGTGLGMAVVWGTVQDHQGTINVTSPPGEGTVFELYFPVTREEMDISAEALSLAELMGCGEKILVVDDVRAQREIARLMLSRLNYKVTTVPSGETAVKYLASRETDMVILDMIMDPGIDGLDTYREIIRVRPGQKAIITSGFAENDRVREAQRLGAGEYVKKPYTLEKIGVTLKKAFARD